MQPGAPLLHDNKPGIRAHDPRRNIVGAVDWSHGDVAQGFAEADVVHEGTYVSQRVQHVPLENGAQETVGPLNWPSIRNSAPASAAPSSPAFSRILRIPDMFA